MQPVWGGEDMSMVSQIWSPLLLTEGVKIQACVAASNGFLRLMLFIRLAQLKWTRKLFGAVAQCVTQTTLSSITEVRRSRKVLGDMVLLQGLEPRSTV